MYSRNPWYKYNLYHSAWAYERRRHSAQIPCSEVEPLKPGYMRVARLLRFLLITVKSIIYKNIFKAQLVVHYSTSHLYRGFLQYMGFVPFVQFYVFPRASPSGIHKTALRVQTPCTVHVETHGTNITWRIPASPEGCQRLVFGDIARKVVLWASLTLHLSWMFLRYLRCLMCSWSCIHTTRLLIHLAIIKFTVSKHM